jgi:hypothetical protein
MSGLDKTKTNNLPEPNADVETLCPDCKGRVTATEVWAPESAASTHPRPKSRSAEHLPCEPLLCTLSPDPPSVLHREPAWLVGPSQRVLPRAERASERSRGLRANGGTDRSPMIVHEFQQQSIS